MPVPGGASKSAGTAGGHLQGSRDVEKLAGKKTCRPKHLDADVRTGTIPWELIEEQRLFGSQRGSL
jgi:hypothetical protein